MKNLIVDRLLGFLVGGLIALPTALIWRFLTLKSIAYCESDSFGSITCGVVEFVYWSLLIIFPAIGIVFGTKSVIKTLSKLWGTDKQPPEI